MHALEIGADDYLAKPFGMRELVARVQAALRRAASRRPRPRAEPIVVEGLVIDADQQRAFLLDEGDQRRDARLTPTEFRLLWTLAENQGRVMSRDELQQRVWNVPYRPRDRSVDVCVEKLREKLEPPLDAALPADALRHRLPLRGRASAGRRAASEPGAAGLIARTWRASRAERQVTEVATLRTSNSGSRMCSKRLRCGTFRACSPTLHHYVTDWHPPPSGDFFSMPR